jgi:hypothetical protein
MINPYEAIRKANAEASSEREKLRNELIDQGYKPTEEELDQLLLLKSQGVGMGDALS